jgi:hypothetical protein
VQAVEAEIGRVTGDQARVRAEVDAISAAQTRRISIFARATLLAQLLTGALRLIPSSQAGVKSAHAIHIEYYAAVAGIMPVLLIAGFVELAILALRPAVWAVLNFAVPAIGGGGAALVALGAHDSTPLLRFLTVWGLLATMFSLIAYVVMHTSSGTGP